MGNCASARAKPQTSTGECAEEKYFAAISTLAAREQELSHIHKQLEATTAYAQGIAHEASTLRERVWGLEELQRQSSLHVRVLDDGTIIRPIVPQLDQRDAEAIRQRLHEFLMWEKDEVCEKSWQLEREWGESEVGRKRVEEEVQELRREVESVRARTPTPISDVRERVLGNIEAIRNGTWKGKAEGTRFSIVGSSREPVMQERGTLGPVDEYVSTSAHPNQLLPGHGHDKHRPQMQQPIHLEELLKQKVEAFAIQERLVQSLMRERDELRTRVTHFDEGSRRRRDTRTSYAEAQLAASRRIQTIPRDPTDSAVDVYNCLDCEDLRAEIWCLSKSIESAHTLNATHIGAKEAAEQLLASDRASHGLSMQAYQRKLQKVAAELLTTKSELSRIKAKLRQYKAYIRDELIPPDDERMKSLAPLEDTHDSVSALKTQLGKAHARIVELAASKEQAEAKILSQQKELRETRRLAMRQSRASAGTARGF